MAIFKVSLFILVGILAAASQAKHNSAEDLIGHVWMLKSSNYPNYYVRHQNYWVRIDKSDKSRLYKLDSSWRVVKGLCGYGISFQSKNYPTHYLRHRNFRARIDKYENSRLFKLDSCFIPHSGLANDDYYSFQPSNYPGYFLRHQNYVLRISPDDGSALFKQDATFEAIHCEH